MNSLNSNSVTETMSTITNLQETGVIKSVSLKKMQKEKHESNYNQVATSLEDAHLISKQEERLLPVKAVLE